MSPSGRDTGTGWAGAWLDAVAFAGGLAMAWFGKWETTDLVWSLWLSSLVVGYALIIWNASSTLRSFAGPALRDRSPDQVGAKIATGLLLLGGMLGVLAFFAVHFGGFHFVHSAFLASFFPLRDDLQASGELINLPMYAEVVRRYWIFLPVAFLAEREAFRAPAPETRDADVTATSIAQRKKVGMNASMAAPYKNVIRMHLLIFFFAAAHFARLDGFAIYAVVYAVYFFPWRLVKRRRQ